MLILLMVPSSFDSGPLILVSGFNPQD